MRLFFRIDDSTNLDALCDQLNLQRRAALWELFQRPARLTEIAIWRDPMQDAIDGIEAALGRLLKGR